MRLFGLFGLLLVQRQSAIYCRSTMAIKTPASVLLLFLAQGQFVTSVSAECCALKTVGNYSYTLTTWEGAIPDECKDSCAYTKDGYGESLYCFAPGNLPVVCLTCNPCSECDGKETRCENTPSCLYDTVNEVCSPKGTEETNEPCDPCSECDGKEPRCENTPTCFYDTISEVCSPKQLVENTVIFEENGEIFEQKHAYSPDTKEAVITVPAHGDYPETKFIMQGRSSNSAAAGKMIVASENRCSLEDMPDEINPEDMLKENRREKNTRQKKEVKMYRIQSDVREATEEEQQMLSETMKSACASKTIVVSSIETINEEEFLKTSIANFANKAASRIKKNETDNFEKNPQKNSRAICSRSYYGCATVGAKHCVRWDIVPENEEGDKPLVHYRGHVSHCIFCCPEPNTKFPVCKCINNGQRFATAFAITSESVGGAYDCTSTKTPYTRWDPNTNIAECQYTEGSCVV